jgi:HTH-type transcriptional regulator / antitoxin HigA
MKHPGTHLKEMIEERGWLQRDLSFILGCPEKGLNLIFSGKRGISPEMSKALGHALGVSEDYFADLQKAYDLSLAKAPNPAISLRAKMQEKYPIREMIKRGWIHNSKNVDDLERELAAFFAVSDPSEIPYLTHAAKKSNYEEKETPPIQLAWLFRVKQIANSISVPKYSRSALLKSVGHMRELLLAPEDTRHVPRALHECGVRFILVEPLPKAKIDGVTFWLDHNSPVIGLSFRFDRLDNFWFVLRHEIEHVLNEDGKEMAVIDDIEEYSDSSSDSIPESEKKSNTAAADFCVPSEKIESFLRRKYPFYYEKDVVAFAKVNHIHPALVVGQIHNKTKRYDYLRSYLVKTRQFVAPNAMVDGWGQTVPIIS